MTFMQSAPLIAPRRRSLAVWSALALVMVAISYVLTVFLALAGVYLPWLWLSSAANIGTVALFVFGVLMSATMLWSIVPRVDRFPKPGARLDEARDARLFTEIRQIANSLAEPMPAEVYAIANVNAWVAERGGFLGFGNRRVLAVGLPLVSVLTTGELRAVLAHEFAHYYGGDTRLGRWVFGAREAMTQLLVRLTAKSVLVSAMRVLGRVAVVGLAYWLVVTILSTYWKLFMRATNLLSRRQEYRADELASLVAGGSELAGGLRRIAGAGPMLPVFWREEMLPAMAAGLRPPFAEGFQQRLQAPPAAAAAARRVEEALKNPAHNAFDTHPPLRDRLAAIAAYPGKNAPDGDTPAALWLGDAAAVEKELLEVVLPQAPVAQMKAVTWDEVGDRVYVERWRLMVAQYASLVEGWKVGDLPSVVDRIPEMAKSIRDPKGTLLTREQRAERVHDFVAGALSLALVRRGWKLHTTPGELFMCQGQERLAPRAVVDGIASNAAERFGWAEKARALGIEDIPLVGEVAKD